MQLQMAVKNLAYIRRPIQQLDRTQVQIKEQRGDAVMPWCSKICCLLRNIYLALLDDGTLHGYPLPQHSCNDLWWYRGIVAC